MEDILADVFKTRTNRGQCTIKRDCSDNNDSENPNAV